MQGILWMLIAIVAFSVMILLLRIATLDTHPFVVAFWRNAFGVVCMLPWLVRVGWRGLAMVRPRLQLMRGVINTCAMLCWFTGLARLEIPTAVALSFSAPLFVTIGAALFLREDVRARRWAAVAIGFVGVLIIIRPSPENLDPGAFLVVASALFGAGAFLFTKHLTQFGSGSALVMNLMIIMTVLTLGPALLVWELPSAEALGVIALVALVGTVGHYCVTRALQVADASVVIPFDYMKLPLTAVAGYFLFREVMDLMSWFGASVIVGTTLYIAHREAVRARQAHVALPRIPPRNPS